MTVKHQDESKRSHPLCALVASLAVAWAAACGSPQTTEASRPPVADPERSSVVASNTLRKDYAGSEACAPCHAEIHEQWLRSPMRGMTRRVQQADVAAPFDGGVFRFKRDAVRFEQHADRRYMRVERSGKPPELWRVTKVIGGRYREDFAGVRVADTGADSGPLGPEPHERVLPLSWLRFAPGWRPKGYSVMVTERDRLAPGTVWRQTCIFCHNTTPVLSTLYDDLHAGGLSYQGAISDNLLPPERRWRWKIANHEALERELRGELSLLESAPAPEQGASTQRLLAATLRATRRSFDEQHLVEIGIGCEACHNGSREHAASPSRRPTFELRGEVLGLSAGEEAPPTRAQWVNRTCARCHTVLFSKYEHTWEGGRRRAGPGGSNINSGEARDFLLGGCATELSCTRCHDPHSKDRASELARFDTVAGNAVCLDCHREKSDPDALRAHTRHDPTGEGSACAGCHMPKKNMGLDYGLTRYHRIGSPNDVARVERDRPLECALCHADQPVAKLVEAMESWWGKRFDRAALRRLYGPDLGVLVLDATLERGKPHEQAVAMVVLGDRRGRDALALLLPHFSHPYPLVRRFAHQAAEIAAGRRLTVDLDADPPVIDAEVDRWRRSLPAELTPAR
jgi:predicted CXXCH cytochrome family protein